LLEGAPLMIRDGAATRWMTEAPSHPCRDASVIAVPVGQLADIVRDEQREISGKSGRELSDLISE
jgi:hypothetical protein